MYYAVAVEDIERIEHFMKMAIDVAPRSGCRKSKRGVIIEKDGVFISEGYVKPTSIERCCVREHIRDNSRTELCDAVHAEMLAIHNAHKALLPVVGARMYHIKVKEGRPVQSGKPSCTLCSRNMLEAGIAEFVLWQDEGYAIYTAEELNELSFDYFMKK